MKKEHLPSRQMLLITSLNTSYTGMIQQVKRV
nr:MAG TPA: hypothetical protein [Inoviridae sp.]